MRVKTVFMGSPDFALPTLRELANLCEVVGVVTQPDRPAGRGKILTPPPVKKLAVELGFPVIQPTKLREPEAQAQMHAWSPDLIVVAAFGQILRQNVLDLPCFGCINVHASYLPRWRGAAPIQAAILAGDEFTGVTIMKMDAGIDTGMILAQRKVLIEPDDYAGNLSDRLAQVGAELLTETLQPFLLGKIVPVMQDDTQATYAKMLKKEDGLLDFDQTAAQLERQVRAYFPWPASFFMMNGEMVKVRRTHIVAGKSTRPGSRLVVSGFPAVACSQDILVLDEIQPAGKKPMSGELFLRGMRSWVEAG